MRIAAIAGLAVMMDVSDELGLSVFGCRMFQMDRSDGWMWVVSQSIALLGG